jgi:hypothetical protein
MKVSKVKAKERTPIPVWIATMIGCSSENTTSIPITI